MEKHVILVAAIKIGFGALGVLAAMVVFVSVVGRGLISGYSEAIAFTGVVGTAIALFLLLLSVPGIVGGLGLLKWKPWARILVLILAVLNLLSIPIGTAVGIYTIWALMQDETAELFAAGSGS